MSFGHRYLPHCFLLVVCLSGCANQEKANQTVSIEYESRYAATNLFGFGAEDEYIPGIQVTVPADATYFVESRGDRLIFLGIDQPLIVDDRETDVYRTCSKMGRVNDSRAKRAYAEAESAFTKLKPLIESADDATLLHSLRYTHNGYTDYFVSRDGNAMIGRELSKRLPIDPELLKKADAKRARIFMGISAPPLASVQSHIEFVAESE